MNTTPPIESLLSESALAARLGIPRASFQSWRTSGALKPETHFIRGADRAYHITAEGEVQVLKLSGIQAPPPAPERMAVTVQAIGVMPRVLRCKQVSGAMCSVRLTAPRVFASQFRRGDALQVLATTTEGVFEYDGDKPRRVRI